MQTKIFDALRLEWFFLFRQILEEEEETIDTQGQARIFTSLYFTLSSSFNTTVKEISTDTCLYKYFHE